MSRVWQIDFLRGTAVCMLVIFHFVWDLRYFGVINFDIYSGFWGAFQVLTASLFIFLSGFSMVLSYLNNRNNFPAKWFFRTSKIAIAAFFVSAFTLVFFPDNFIYFGILHFIAFCSFMFAFLVNKPLISLLLSSFIFLFFKTGILFDFSNNLILFLGPAAPRQTFDFFPLIPWGSVFLLGIFLGNVATKNNYFSFEKPRLKIFDLLAFLGKNSLIAYLLHQAFLFPLAWFISAL